MVSNPVVTSATELKSVKISNNSHEVLMVMVDELPEEASVSDNTYYIDRATGTSHLRRFSDNVWSWSTTSGVFDPESLSIKIPLEFVRYCGKFEVQWEYSVEGEFAESYTDIQQHTVIQPLFTPRELKEFDPDFENMGVTDTAIMRLERVIRAIIERSTGQKFELSYGTEMGRSYNTSSLILPKRLVYLEGYSGYISGVRSTVESDGWIVRARYPHVNIHVMNANPIYDVYTTNGFKDDLYHLKGEWGYRSVPEQIKLAAMLLAQDYGCRESVWRDRYIEMMKNVDWSIQYHDKAFEGTGNIKVDTILESYMVNNMVVV